MTKKRRRAKARRFVFKKLRNRNLTICTEVIQKQVTPSR